MLIEIILFLILGVVLGTFTGLTPGIHTNLIGIFIVSISGFFLFVNPIYFIVIITSMAITHTFVDFIPSVFLGCPDTDTELSILPGHELLKEGLGYEAVYLTCYGKHCCNFYFNINFISFNFFNHKNTKFNSRNCA
jgi:putative membrane protein